MEVQTRSVSLQQMGPSRATSSGCSFVPGETDLKSMTKQPESIGRHHDDKCQYKADGTLRLMGKKSLEILLLETSSGFESKNRCKISFDHYKGTFGTVDMLKSIPDVKVFFFLHAEDKLHFWSLSFKHDGIYELWRETHLKIRPLFSDKADFMHDFMPFFWTMKQMLRGTIDSIDDLAKSHAAIKAKHRYSSNAPVLLTSIITPSIIKLTQHEDSKGLADLGPFYSPFTSPLQSPNASPIHISETVTDDV